MITLTSPRVVAFYARTGLNADKVNEHIVDLYESFGTGPTEHQLLRAVRDLGDTVQTALSSDQRERQTQLAKVSDAVSDKLAVLLPQAREETVRCVRDELVAFQKQDAMYPALLANLQLKLIEHQQPVISLLQTAREEQIGRRAVEDQLHQQLNGFLQTMHTTQIRGAVAERQLESLLMDLFPSAEVQNTTGKTASGDFMMLREGKPKILVENKEYTRNVDEREVTKFVRDILLHRCSGLFLSQRTGIVGKQDFEIDIQDGHVLLYAHKVEMDPARVRAAVSIIDSLAARLAAIVDAEGDSGVSIPKHAIDEMNTQYRAFVKTRDGMLAALKEYTKTAQTSIMALEMPSLATYLDASYVSVRSEIVSCDVCSKQFSGARGLATHMRSHKP